MSIAYLNSPRFFKLYIVNFQTEKKPSKSKRIAEVMLPYHVNHFGKHLKLFVDTQNTQNTRKNTDFLVLVPCFVQHKNIKHKT